MVEPVLIVHGVNNHDPALFEAQVQALQDQLGSSKRLIPVHWGELGGQSSDIGDCLPAFSDGQWHVRADELLAPGVAEQLVRALSSHAGHGLSNAERADLISAQVQPETLVRSTPAGDAQAVRSAVAQELDATQVLQYLDDTQTLAIVGRTIDAVLRERPASGAVPGPADDPYAVRGDADTRGLLDPVKRVTVHVLRGIDEALGRLVANQLGQLNQAVASVWPCPPRPRWATS
jgi:hypothetical protein